MPVINRNWCIKTAYFGDTAVTYGVLWACLSALALIDFRQQRIYSVPYKTLKFIERDGDNTLLRTVYDNAPLRFSLRVPRPSKSSPTVGLFFDVLKILGGQSGADHELELQRIQREADDYHQRLRLADGFVEGFFTIFSRIIRSDIQALKP